jgi:hypothetical protein
LFVLLFINGSLSAARFNVSSIQELRSAINSAALNEEEDTIILADGIYQTTADGLGTIEFLTDKNHDLTLQGSGTDNVILSGGNADRVMKFMGLGSSCRIYLSGLTVQKGFISGESGGGIYSNLEIHLENVKLYMNEVEQTGHYTSPDGGTGSAIFLDWQTAVRGYINNSVISYNNNLAGGHSAVNGRVNISNSTISNNLRGAIYVSGGNVYKNLKIIDNSGYAIATCGDSWYLHDSLIEGNEDSASPIYGSVIADGCAGIDKDSIISNTVIRNNSAEQYVFRSTQGMKISNVIFHDNTVSEGNIDFDFKDHNQIINSLFVGSRNKVIFGDGSIIVNSIFISPTEITAGDLNKFYNNYIDESIITGSNFKQNNIYTGATLGFLDETDGNFRLTGSSDLIDAGSTDVSGVQFPETDLDGNTRVLGATIDIGPYEFAYSNTDGEGEKGVSPWLLLLLLND